MHPARLPPISLTDHGLFLDIDGTLLDLAPTPESVVVPEGLVEVLSRLQERLDGALALVSGRALASIDPLFAPLSLTAAGQHGAELRCHGKAATHLPPLPALASVRQQLAALIADLDGVLVEDKGHTIALHYRQNPEAAGILQECLNTLVADQTQGLALLEGKKVYEIKPNATHKGSAVQFFMQAPPFAGRKPVYVGDDRTDEDGFAAAETLGGYAIGVGPRYGDSSAYWLPSPAAVRDWLSAKWA